MSKLNQQKQEALNQKSMKKSLIPVASNSPELAGRIPFKLILDEQGNLSFRWIFIGQHQFSEPFFDETISACLSLPENSTMPFTNAETLIERAEAVDAVLPSAFIFHISRCGSTLLAQQLCVDERFIVLSEVPLLDDILRIPFTVQKNYPLVDKLFCAILRLLGQKRNGTEKYLFVKTDSWHLMFFETIRKLFPDIPSLLLYRSPKEVIRSHQKLRGRHAVAGPLEKELFGFEEYVSELFPDAYFELVLQCYFEKCLQIISTDKNAKALSYHDGAMKMLLETLDACEISLEELTLSTMEKRTEQHSKYPENKFAAEEKVAGDSSPSLSVQLFDQLNELQRKADCNKQVSGK